MVVRLWRGRAGQQNADAYLEHVTTLVFPRLLNIDGFLGGRVLRRRGDAEVEFVVLTEWASWDAIRAFAGNSPDVAVVEPAARLLLTRFDEHVEHFDLAHMTSIRK